MRAIYDLTRIKANLPPISELLTRDGHEIKRSGLATFVCCPFHEEKTPSCRVDDNSGRYHCFGCGSTGDSFDYWQKSRDLSFQDALAQLASLANIGPETLLDAPRAAPAKIQKPEKLVGPITGDDLGRWMAACEALERSASEIQRISQWRGIEPDCVRFAARQGLMGAYPYWGQTREAFLVEMPTEAGNVPVSVHIRLAPGSKGNEQQKPSWRFNPSGCGSWPFVIGDPQKADNIFLLEGQWDALALVSLMGWHQKWPPVAVIGLRGSTSGAKLLKHQLNPKAHLFAIADADGAGARWFEEDGLLDKLHERVKRVTAFWPTTEKSDLNDLVKSGELTRDLMLSYLLPKMASRRNKTSGPTFLAWCKKNKGAAGQLGTAINHILEDEGRPKGRTPLRAWERHWRKTNVTTELFTELVLAWQHYRAACTH